MTVQLTDFGSWPTSSCVRAILVQNFAGQLIDNFGQSNSLSNQLDRSLLVSVRNQADLIIVGSATVKAENPPPTSGYMFVLSNSGEVDPQHRVWRSPKTYLVSTKPNSLVPTLQLPQTSVVDLLQQAANLNCQRILVEGGMAVFRQFIAANALDEALITVTPSPGSGQTLHRSQFGLTLRHQITLANNVFQRWSRER